jgi:hypothetical protein
MRLSSLIFCPSFSITHLYIYIYISFPFIWNRTRAMFHAAAAKCFFSESDIYLFYLFLLIYSYIFKRAMAKKCWPVVCVRRVDSACHFERDQFVQRCQSGHLDGAGRAVRDHPHQPQRPRRLGGHQRLQFRPPFLLQHTAVYRLVSQFQFLNTL